MERVQATQLKSFGDNVRRERVLQKITQERLAEMVGLHPRTVQKIEAGRVNILLTTFIRFQRALQCPWENLLAGHNLLFQSPKNRWMPIVKIYKKNVVTQMRQSEHEPQTKGLLLNCSMPHQDIINEQICECK